MNLSNTTNYVEKKSQKKYEKDCWAMQNHAAKLLVGHRISFCRRSPISMKENIKIVERLPLPDSEKKRFGFTGLQLCGCLHGCPMCSIIISKEREKEIRQACEEAQKKGLLVYMLTLTQPHQKYDMLQTQLEKLMGYKEENEKRVRGAVYNLMHSRTWKNLFLTGYIKKFETTYGKNGWHPHHHMILFFDPSAAKKAGRVCGVDEFKLHFIWEKACVKAGFDAPALGVGLRLDRASKPSDIACYIAKMGSWDFAKEMTKDQAKKSKKDGSTPWQLLRKSMNGCKKSGRLFVEYVDSTKGVRSIVWSRGLREKFYINNVSDKEISEDLNAVKRIIYDFVGEQIGIDENKKAIEATGLELWYMVLEFGSRYVLLRCAEKGASSVRRYLFVLIAKHKLQKNMPYIQPVEIRLDS